jgi:tRNA(Phe) wybutosine-synthesizing methylase Tyw3
MKPNKIIIAANVFGKMAVEVNNEVMFTDEWQVKTPLSEEEKEFVDKEYEKQLLAYEAIEYQRKRKPEYPKIEDQLDLLYHEGIEGWKKEIQKVKDKYPKPVVKESEEAPSE